MFNFAIMTVLTIQQKGVLRLLTVLVVVLSFSFYSLASKGGGDEKEKKGYVLKFNGFEVKKQYMNPFSLMSGATYKGTYDFKSQGKENNSVKDNHSIITYKKGNTIYILPVKSKGVFGKFKTPSKD